MTIQNLFCKLLSMQIKKYLFIPTIALRADMDALPVTEQTGLPFASKQRTTYLGQDEGVKAMVYLALDYASNN